MSSGARRPFDGLFGDPARTTNLPEGDLRHVTRRAQRMAQRRGQSNGAHADIAEIRERAEQDGSHAPHRVRSADRLIEHVHAQLHGQPRNKDGRFR